MSSPDTQLNWHLKITFKTDSNTDPKADTDSSTDPKIDTSTDTSTDTKIDSKLNFQLELLRNIPFDKYKEFQIFLVYMSIIGFLYDCKLKKMKTPNFYRIESSDLAYWTKMMYTKLNITDHKPPHPAVEIASDVDDANAYPVSIVCYDNNHILEVYDIY